MTLTRMLPALAFALGAAGCSEDSDATGPGEGDASVRFVNAIADAGGRLLLAADGSPVGASLAFASQAAVCTTVHSGVTTLSLKVDGASAMLTTQKQFAPRGDYTVIAAGTSAQPQFIVLSNNVFDGNLSADQTAVRFVNLMSSGVTTFNIFTGSNMFGDPTYSDVVPGASTAFTKMSAGAQTFIFTNQQDEEIFRTSGQINLKGGGIFTIAVMPTASGSFQLLAIGEC